MAWYIRIHDKDEGVVKEGDGCVREQLLREI